MLPLSVGLLSGGIPKNPIEQDGTGTLALASFRRRVSLALKHITTVNRVTGG
jgi:hypothetical protein